MDLTTCYCRNRYCARYGLTGPQARLIRAGWHRRAPQLECVDCRHRFSARAGTAYAGIRSSDLIFRDGVRQLAEGASIRATARNIECDKDTVLGGCRVWADIVSDYWITSCVICI